MVNSFEAAKRALIRTFKGEPPPDAKGYLKWPQENLLPGIELRDVEDELRGGAGDELRMKFCAVHSSAALAVNSFAYFKKHPSYLYLLGRTNFARPRFERQCPTGLGGTPPNIDVWLEGKTEVIAVESKLLEYFTAKEARYSDSYKREVLNCEDCWWNVLEASKVAGKRYLDVGQLVKHYLGLRRFMSASQYGEVTLLYLFWEPLNADSIDVCRKHREEIQTLSSQVHGSHIHFKSMTYSQLWNEWNQLTELQTHVMNLRDRYEVEL